MLDMNRRLRACGHLLKRAWHRDGSIFSFAFSSSTASHIFWHGFQSGKRTISDNIGQQYSLDTQSHLVEGHKLAAGKRHLSSARSDPRSDRGGRMDCPAMSVTSTVPYWTHIMSMKENQLCQMQ